MLWDDINSIKICPTVFYRKTLASKRRKLRQMSYFTVVPQKFF